MKVTLLQWSFSVVCIFILDSSLIYLPSQKQDKQRYVHHFLLPTLSRTPIYIHTHTHTHTHTYTHVYIWYMKVLVTQLCLTLCYPMDYSLPGSSVHGFLQARILEWVAIPLSRSSLPRDQTQVSHVADRLFTVWATREAPYETYIYIYIYICLK